MLQGCDSPYASSPYPGACSLPTRVHSLPKVFPELKFLGEKKFFFAVQGFELRALHLPGRRSIT
jgi:hypothetical protein